MDKKQIEKFKAKLVNKQCPICKAPILQYSSIVNCNTITDMEALTYSKIDTSKDYTDIECEYCGYVMKFNTKKLLE